MRAGRSFLVELRRRNVLRAGVLYIGAIWALAQGISQLGPAFGAPEWFTRWFVIAGVIGFPFWLLLAWFYEWTPQGIKRDADIDHSETATRASGKKFDKAIMAVLSLAVVLLLANQFVARTGNPAAAVAAPAPAAVSSIPEKSIAVLPFTDLSQAHDQEYFSDGMAEELLNALAKLPDLQVAGRTSSFSFKGKSGDIREIGRQLAVANVLEGSVRKQGNRVRITAQLIRANDGYHLWSETYDGDLNDIFDLQEKIARAITERLQVILHSAPQRLVKVATDNPEAYTLYLKATTTFNHRDGPHFVDAIADLQQAIALDPKFARAHARLASLYSIAVNYTPMPLDEALAATEREARAAIALDPKLAEPHAALGQIYDTHRRPQDARRELFTAVALDPVDANANAWLGAVLFAEGYLREGTAYFDKALAIDPLLPIAVFYRGVAHLWNGERDAARKMSQQAVDVGFIVGERMLGLIDRDEGRDAPAIAHLTRGERPFLVGLPDDTSEWLARGIVGDREARRHVLDIFERYLSAHAEGPISGDISRGFLMLGEPERALAVGQQRLTNNDGPLFFALWSPYGSAARKLPQFNEFARSVGWIEVWDQNGAPDHCKRRATGDYLCE